MERSEWEEIRSVLRAELQEFFSWIMEEVGGGYFIEHPEGPPEAWEEEVREAIGRRLRSERAELWERDRHAFFDHPDRPSIYRLMDAADLECFHYREDFYCEHDKQTNFLESGLESAEGEEGGRYEEPFGVLLASPGLGWMYRLDFCDQCGLVEIWSMRYNPGEIALYDPGRS
jgi:hypothetical protein